MRPLELVLLAATLTLLATACSRLTFVKPSAQRKGMDQIAPEYTFKESASGKSRMEARRRISAADRKLRAGELDEAAAEARAALKADPSLPEAHTVMALVAGRQGRHELAGQHHAEAARVGPSGATYNNYGAWLCGNERAGESLEWFDNALRDPRYGDRAGAMANAGACAAKAGQYDRVERDLRAALELEPTNAVALGAMAEDAFRRGRYLEARAFSERRLAAAPATPATLELASRIEDKLGDSVAAARYVRRLRMEFPQAGNAFPGESITP
ncbi:type IV pilus biogenesis/stability protein PilW [Luteimonas viscosa]|uniref:Type IV pilus biogenesis/stability protein PilW n=1 Tax=Luteimonas viscosa TaxID=1132694 RepID=A0A5D4XIB3_9GAMM|nr:type IV pilus biogenesis/stability protein PilW [Luteimonas viscosa]TYT23894.1 type IV pilus biogenesis/stability protein PilW [Luteimonas viscosa]